VVLDNVLHTGLMGVLWEVLGGSPGLENRRRGELGDGDPAAAAGARAPASRRVGLANTRTCKLTGCEGRARCAQTVMDAGGAMSSQRGCQWRAAAARCSHEERRRRPL
jgi:hypothetical protein